MEKFNKGRLALGIICLLLVTGVALGLYHQYFLSIKDVSRDKTVFEITTKPGDNLWIVFVNSVELLPVADHFVVNDRHQIVFTETIYQAPYAGYLHPEKKELIAPGTTRIAGINRLMEEVTFFAGYDSKHLLFVNGKWTPLYHVAQGGDLIQITVSKRSRSTTLLARLLFHEQ
ncbi:MAG: DUF1850 domain-containing protein, partial [Deltaproteobacteria bacterium]|nr:DUF1850 domain-containing protein [Deltaproteobacteria bacterium]